MVSISFLGTSNISLPGEHQQQVKPNMSDISLSEQEEATLSKENGGEQSKSETDHTRFARERPTGDNAALLCTTF